MTALKNDTLLRALAREPTPHTPIWLMRQAGRYLPEYNATRKRAGSFLGLATHPEFATEVTLQPLERYPLDAAILFSDILTVPDAMGLGLHFEEGEGPKFRAPVRDEAAVMALAAPDLDRLGYVFEAVRQIVRALDGRVPLIGFSGSPWTLACYMVEGGGSTDFRTIKTMLYRRPDLLEKILAVNCEAVSAYLCAQVEAGAQAVMLFDTWGGVLADAAFRQYSLTPMQGVLERFHARLGDRAVPTIVFTKGGGQWLVEMAAIGATALGLDWTTDLGRARRTVGAQCALQGNLDPAVLFGGEAAIRNEAARVLDSYAFAHGPDRPDSCGHIFNLGHGISQFTPPESVAVLCDAVRQHSAALRRV